MGNQSSKKTTESNPKRYVSSTEYTTEINESGVVTLKSHKDAIFALTVLPDDRIVSGSRDYSIKIWQKDQENSWKCVRSLDGHRGSITSLTVYPPSFLISGSLDSTMRVWNVDSGIGLFSVDCGTSIYSLYTFKTNEFASGLDDGTLKLWHGSAPTFKCRTTIKAHDDGIRCIQEIPINNNSSSSSDLFATGSYDFTVKLWNRTTGECLGILKGHTDAILCLAVLPERRLVSGGLTKDSSIRIWDLETKECVEQWRAHEDGIMGFCVLMEDGLLASSGMDRKIKIWNVEEKKCIKILEGHNHYIYALKLLNNGTLVSGCEDTTVKIWPTELYSQ
jgi:WD40 repeat protein